VFQDIYRYISRPGIRTIFVLLIDPGLQACVAYRLAHRLLTWRLRPMALMVWRASFAATNADINPAADIGQGLCLPHPAGVVIGANVVIGTHCTLYDGVNLGVRRWSASGEGAGAQPRLGDRVTVGTGAKVLGGVEVGGGAVIGANAVVLCSVPANALAVGVPARIVERAAAGH
jgi:serine O-acetyltransferase